MKAMYNRGSEWRKWDLHFHTPSSYDYKDGSVSNMDIIETLNNNNISVVAITDHHLIDIVRFPYWKRTMADVFICRVKSNRSIICSLSTICYLQDYTISLDTIG